MALTDPLMTGFVFAFLAGTREQLIAPIIIDDGAYTYVSSKISPN